MSKLEELINALCPDGVGYKTLSDIANYSSSRIDAKEVDAQSYVGVDNLLPDKMGKIDSSYVPTEGRLTRFSEGDILIGNIRPYLNKIWLATHDGGTNGDVLAIQINNRKTISPRYLFYVLSSDQFFLYDMQNAKGAKMPRGDKSAVIKYLIPLPPLPVQHEIVRILDNFTLLTAELTAELTARKKQYEYFRNLLLNFNRQRKGFFQWMTLGELGAVCMCKRIMKAETSPDGDVPFFKIGTFGKEPDAYISQGKYDEYRKAYSFPKKGDILISAAGTIGRAVVYDGKPAYYQDSNIVWIDNDENKVLNKYLFYCYAMKPWSVSNGGTIARLYNENLSKAKIPVPPLKEQERIVAILDRFDTLCNDLTSGLPAEIEARRKQYEYYRDRILTFKEKVA
ncbi:MAG: restriction endonuclease subunit S [Clostridia bacterium]|nr:restriction endonuclease subunit S [Clostridia bacterium]